MSEDSIVTITADVIQSVTKVDVAFGGGYKFLPPYETIPAEFKNDVNPFVRLANDLMYKGVPGPKTPSMTLRPDLVPVAPKIPDFMGSILSSFQPKHEHKIAGAAFLLSQMFTVG